VDRQTGEREPAGDGQTVDHAPLVALIATAGPDPVSASFFGPRYGLPKAICAHQTYYFWGPRQYSGAVMILLQSERHGAERFFASIQDGPVLDGPYAMAEEHYTILIGRGLKMPLAGVWPRLKQWN
jgi:hypothetical protein